MKRGFRAPLQALPEDVRERLETEGLAGSILVDFDYPPAPRCRAIQRSHPLVSVLAVVLLPPTIHDSSSGSNEPNSSLLIVSSSSPLMMSFSFMSLSCCNR